MAKTTETTLEGGIRALSLVPKSVRDEAKQANADHLAMLIERGQAQAYDAGGAAVYVAPTIRGDGYENLLVGGNNPTSGGGTASDVLMGTIWGSSTHAQFPPRIGPADSYYLIDEIEDLAEQRGDYAKRDEMTLEEALRKSLEGVS